MLIDTDAIKTKTNLRQYIGRQLGKPKYSAKNYDQYKCPLHHESKGASLSVYDDHWQCWGKCQAAGDVIAWAMRYENMTFSEACRVLGGQVIQGQPAPRRPPQPPQPAPVADDPPNAEWQAHAESVIHHAQRTLWGPNGGPALAYLHWRGFDNPTIRLHKIGYIPGRPDEWLPVKGWNEGGRAISVPCGITIPHIADNHIWGVKVRRAAGAIKYQQIRGGTKALYRADDIDPGIPVLIVEGEFDAMAVSQCRAGLDIAAVSLGSASNKRIGDRWIAKMMHVPGIFVRMDSDAAGESAVDHLKMIANVYPVTVPAPHKDINDLLMDRGEWAIDAWVKGFLK